MPRQPTPPAYSARFDSKAVGDHVKHLRELNGWSQGELARQAGVAKQAISNLERGTVTASLTTLAAISNAIGIDVMDVIEVGFRATDLPRRKLRSSAISLLDKLADDNLELAIRQLKALRAWQDD